jgi:glycosyltransferase involved in cell wall biosynthesis
VAGVITPGVKAGQGMNEQERQELQRRTLLVIPVYNHSATLEAVVQQAKAIGWQVLVVDDGSDDSTSDMDAAKLGCELIRHPTNLGKGAAILTGAGYARENGYPYILTLDADGQHDPQEAVKLLAEIKEGQPRIIIGARDMTGVNVPRASVFGRDFSNFWVRLETSFSLPDTQSGMRLYPVQQLLELAPATQRYDFETESLVRLAWAGVGIESVDVGVTYPRKGERISHFHQFKDNARLTLLHFRLVLRHLYPMGHTQLVKKEKAPNQLFHPVKLLRQLLREHATPIQIAAAVWVGIFLGAVPLIGIHTLAIIYTTHKLHLNKVAAVTASQLCIPPLVPFICIQAGYYLFNGGFLYEFTRETLVAQVGDRLLEYLMGSLLVGPVLGFVVAALSYLGAKQLGRLQRFSS